jgi:hypothetical protein
MEKPSLIRKALEVVLYLNLLGRSKVIRELQFYWRASSHFLV